MKNDFLSKVYMYLFLGLLITFLSGYVVSTNDSILALIYNNNKIPWIIMIIELIIAIILPIRIHKLSPMVAKILYFLYALLTGLTFSAIFVLYEMSSIIWIFLVTSILFGIFAIIGKTTKMDLSKWGIYLFMGLMGVLILSIINVFVYNNSLNMTACVIGIIVFLAYVAYDMQRITKLNYYNLSEDNMAIIGAFNLYLDFINIFIKLLRILGKAKDN